MRRDPHLRDHPSPEIYTVFNVKSQVFTPNIHMPGPGVELRTLSCNANVLAITLPHLSLHDRISLLKDNLFLSTQALISLPNRDRLEFTNLDEYLTQYDSKQ